MLIQQNVLPLPFTDEYNPFPSCLNCKSPCMIEDKKEGQLVCKECGLVDTDRVISENCEWRSFECDQMPTTVASRVGAIENAWMLNFGLSTTIAFYDRGDRRNKAGGEEVKRVSQIQKYTSSTFQDHSLLATFHRIRTIAHTFDFPERIIHLAQEILHKINDSNKGKISRRIEALSVLCLYQACKKTGYIRPLRKLRSITQVSKGELARLHRLYYKTLANPKVDSHHRMWNLLNKYCNDLCLPPQFTDRTSQLVDKIYALGILEGKRPESIAGASLYFTHSILLNSLPSNRLLPPVSQINLSLDRISIVAGIAVATLQQAYRVLVHHQCALLDVASSS